MLLLVLAVLVLHNLLDELGLELAVLVVAVGLPDGDVHNVENVGGLLEDVIHLLQRAVAGLGEEEVHNWEDSSITAIG